LYWLSQTCHRELVDCGFWHRAPPGSTQHHQWSSTH
jgi:hypothetical protein